MENEKNNSVLIKEKEMRVPFSVADDRSLNIHFREEKHMYL